MGVAHHTHFFTWFEVGRTDYMRQRGCPYSELETQGVFFPVIEAQATYRKPARYDQVLRVETTMEDVTGARVRFAYRVMGDPDNQLLASGYTVHASVNREGIPQRVSAHLRRQLLAEGAGR
jgi:acyl-CoA thioester hydrolase